MYSKNVVKDYEEYGDFSKLWKGEGLAKALQTVNSLDQKGVPVSKDFVRCILQGCIKKKDLRAGRQVHTLIVRIGLHSCDLFAEELIRLFAACNSLPAANQVFHNLPYPGLFTWNAIISAHVQLGKEGSALQLYDKMCHVGIEPDKVTYLHVLKACSSTGDVEKGRLIHGDIILSRCQSDVLVGSAIIDMYAKCRRLEDAEKVFDNLPRRDVVSWGCMIAGHAVYGDSLQALHLLKRMQQEGRNPNQVILSCVLTACANIKAIWQGRLIHDQIITSNLQSDTMLGNSLVDMYVKCGSLEEARKVFHSLPVHDLVTWSAMISGYAQQGHGFPALELYDRMLEQGVKPDKVTFLCLLKACTSVGAIVHGMLVHEGTMRSGLDRDVVVGSALLDMYAKCGSLKEAHKVFNQLLNHDVISWGTMLSGFAQCGDWTSTLRLFEDMQRLGMQPDGVTFASILKACSHSGFLSEGHQYFKSMIRVHSIIPNIEHYNCMVDLLSRTGQLHEAEDLLNTMPISYNIMQWTSLLTSCRTYGNMQLGGRCFNQVFEMDPNDASGYLLMSNIYADNHMWEDADKVEELRKGTGAQRKPGKAWMEVNKKAREFIVGGNSDAHSDVNSTKLSWLSRVMRRKGYVPQLDIVADPMLSTH